MYALLLFSKKRCVFSHSLFVSPTSLYSLKSVPPSVFLQKTSISPLLFLYPLPPRGRLREDVPPRPSCHHAHPRSAEGDLQPRPQGGAT